MTDIDTTATPVGCPDCPHPWSEHEHGGLGDGVGDGCYHRVDRDPEPGDDKWCPCRRTPPLTVLTADQLRAVVDLDGRKWIGPIVGHWEPHHGGAGRGRGGSFIGFTDPLTADERRALALDTLRALTIPATDDTVANVKDQP